VADRDLSGYHQPLIKPRKVKLYKEDIPELAAEDEKVSTCGNTQPQWRKKATNSGHHTSKHGLNDRTPDVSRLIS